jgi:hypothetical protein
VVVPLSENEYRGYLAVGAPGGSAIGRSQEGESRRGIEDASFPLTSDAPLYQVVE